MLISCQFYVLLKQLKELFSLKGLITNIIYLQLKKKIIVDKNKKIIPIKNIIVLFPNCFNFFICEYFAVSIFKPKSKKNEKNLSKFSIA